MKCILLTIIFINLSSNLHAQYGYFDPAQAYLRILLEKSDEGSYQQIGNFKVRGTAFLYGGNQTGDVYLKTGLVKNVAVNYDTYRQVLALNVGNDGQSLIKQLNELDSFVLRANDNTDFKNDLIFVNVNQFDSSRKVFLQRVATGSRFNLYKAYKSDLGYVSTNYIQSELRQFDLNYEYFYTDSQKPGLKKLKLASNAIKKEFKGIHDLSPVVDADDFASNPEKGLIKAFSLLNK